MSTRKIMVRKATWGSWLVFQLDDASSYRQFGDHANALAYAVWRVGL